MSKDHGFIAIHRKIREWEWRDDLKVFSVFIECLCSASYKEKKYRGDILKTGQFTTSYDALAKRSGVSIQSLRTALSKLKSTGELTYETNTQRTKITVLNWAQYQSSTHTSTNQQQTSNKRATTINKENKEKKDNNKKYESVLVELYAKHYPKKVGKKIGIERLLRKIKTDDDLRRFEISIKNYAAFMKEPENEWRHAQDFSTFANKWEDWIECSQGVAWSDRAKNFLRSIGELDE